MLNSGIWRALAWAGVALEAVTFAFVLWSQKGGGAWSIGIFLMLTMVFMLSRIRLANVLTFIVVLAAVSNAGGWAWNWYDDFVWFDEFIHFFTSFALLSAIGYLSFRWGWTNARPGTGGLIVWVAAVGIGLGIIWELIESLFLDLTLADTLLDLLIDALGAAMGGWFAAWIIQEQKSIRRASDAPIDDWA